MAVFETRKREPVFDFLRSVFMISVFFIHFHLSFPEPNNFLHGYKAFAELFVGLSGFMVGFIYLNRKQDLYLMKRGFKILIVYYLVALPIGVVGSSFGNNNYSVLQGVVNTLILQLDMTFIGILRFYALMFIFLPVLLKVYRKSLMVTLLGSVFLFIMSTMLQKLLQFENMFVTNVCISTLQWQMFFVIGLVIGDFYKKGELNTNLLLILSLVVGGVSFTLQFLWFREIPIIKFPYSFEKLLNTLYLAPIYLSVLFYFYKKIKGSILDQTVRVVGRHSLLAFSISEIIRYYFVWGGTRVFHLHFPEEINLLFALLLTFMLVFILKKYEDLKQNKNFLNHNSVSDVVR